MPGLISFGESEETGTLWNKGELIGSECEMEEHLDQTGGACVSICHVTPIGNRAKDKYRYAELFPTEGKRRIWWRITRMIRT